MSDALACFQYLAENAPTWIKSLEILDQRLKEHQKSTTRVAIPTQRKIKRSSSNESVRHSGPDTSSPSTRANDAAHSPGCESQEVTLTATEPILPSPSRKRKTLSLLSAAASGIHKYRSRASGAIYYDSDVQEAFDKLVRNISTGRNTIRKSRMNDRISTMMSMHNSSTNGSLAGRAPVLRSVRSASGMPRFDAYLKENLGSRPGPALRPPPLAQTNFGAIKSETEVQKHDPREIADQALEKAQAFCERGAHQFLRDGDCGEEVNGAKTAFEEVIVVSKQEIARLGKEAENKNADALSVVAAMAKHGNGNTEKPGREKDELAAVEIASSPQSEQRLSVKSHPALIESAGLIEADDDEDDDEELDLALLPRPQTRMMAGT